MKTLLRYIICPVVMLTYIFAYMGFGIHRCSAEGTRELVLLMGDMSCEAIHSHSHFHFHPESGIFHCHSHECGHHHGEECHSHGVHSAACCTTDIYVVTDAQDSDDGSDYRIDAPVAFSFEMESAAGSFVNIDSDRYLSSLRVSPPSLHFVLRV